VNRAGFEQRLTDAMARSKTTHASMAVMYLDIDRFKDINDTHGHLAGDMLLKAFAARLLRTLRSVDTVARLGGDEFTVIMEGLVKPEDAVTVAAKIVHSMQPLFSLESHPVPVSASIGVAFYQGEDITPQALIRQADELLYEAKAAGRNTYCVAPFVKSPDRAESE
jgi:diguanylate cyclase (GGDEF)-like protein